MSLTLYRQCKLGESLSQAISELAKLGQLPDSLGERVLQAFDKVESIFLKYRQCAMTFQRDRRQNVI